MAEQKGVHVSETFVVTRKTEQRFYSDDELLELFPDDSSLVYVLLKRAQEAEAEIERLRAECGRLRVACGPEEMIEGDYVGRDSGGEG